MVNYIFSLNPIFQAIIAGIMCHIFTSSGAATVFFIKKDKSIIMDILISIAAGIMMSAAFFSLLLPSIEISKEIKIEPFITLTVGILLGTILIVTFNQIFDRISNKKNIDNKGSLKKCLLLILSITVHNIPEGLAIGVAFGSIIYGIDGVTVISAWMLALGIGIQNFPEGAAVSIPLYKEGLTKKKAFFSGYISGLVEPIASFIGALVVIKIKVLLPFLLSLAAGAMIYVVVLELIPESQNSKYHNTMAISFIVGFMVMMLLELYL